MRDTRQFVLAVTAVTTSLLLLGIGTLRAKPEHPGKPDPQKPVPATDTVLVKKVTLRGRPAHAGGGKKKAGAATGTLGQPLTGARHALIVGISDYPGTDSDLAYADVDATEMADALTSVYGFGDVQLLTNGAASRAAILAGIDALRASVAADDEVVFFFSGHGMNGAADDGDGEKIDEAIVTQNDAGTEFLPIWDGELKQAFDGFPTSRIVFIFDTCLAGGMDDLQEPGRVILMAAGEHGYSYEGDPWENGEFTYYFVHQALEQGLANTHDYDGDEALSEPEQVTAEEAFDYTKANCDLDRPVISDSFADDLLFVPLGE
jgi:hypothetical protein